MHRNATTVSTKQQRVATLAKQSPQMGFTSLAYLMDVDWLHEAFRRTRKDGAAGAYSEGRLGHRDPTDRHPDSGGQGPSAGGRHVAGTDL